MLLRKSCSFFPADHIMFFIIDGWQNVDWIVEYKIRTMKMFCNHSSRHFLVKSLAECMGKGGGESLTSSMCLFGEEVGHGHHLPQTLRMFSLWNWIKRLQIVVSFEVPRVCFAGLFAARRVLWKGVGWLQGLVSLCLWNHLLQAAQASWGSTGGLGDAPAAQRAQGQWERC